MSRLVQLLKRTPFFLMVSLPSNDPEMAKGAEASGAMALKAHLNVLHPASRTKFGPFARERNAIEGILRSVKIPVGVVPGGETFATREELEMMREMGVDFFDAFASHFPASLLVMKGVGKMAALGEGYTLPMVEDLRRVGVEVIEATIFNPRVYGTPLAAADLAAYQAITRHTPLPVLVPTQKRVAQEEVELLRQAGCRGIVIGAVVTGGSRRTVVKAVEAFSRAISRLR